MAITGFDTANTVTVDTAHKLTCTTNGGNPLPDLSWYKGKFRRRIFTGYYGKKSVSNILPRKIGLSWTKITQNAKETSSGNKYSHTVKCKIVWVQRNIQLKENLPNYNQYFLFSFLFKHVFILNKSYDYDQWNQEPNISYIRIQLFLIGSTQLTNVGELRAIGKIRSLEYQFIAKPEDNAALYKCKASHANVPEPHKEVNITVSVYCKYKS